MDHTFFHYSFCSVGQGCNQVILLKQRITVSNSVATCCAGVGTIVNYSYWEETLEQKRLILSKCLDLILVFFGWYQTDIWCQYWILTALIAARMQRWKRSSRILVGFNSLVFLQQQSTYKVAASNYRLQPSVWICWQLVQEITQTQGLTSAPPQNGGEKCSAVDKINRPIFRESTVWHLANMNLHIQSVSSRLNPL